MYYGGIIRYRFLKIRKPDALIWTKTMQTLGMAAHNSSQNSYEPPRRYGLPKQENGMTL